MHRVDPLPASINRFHEIGGELQFAVFDDADGDADSVFRVVCETLPITNAEALRASGFRRLDDATFYGEWYEAETDSLLLVGAWDSGRGKFINPRLRDLPDHRFSGGGPIPEAGAGGEFAYAFSRPPYGMRASPAEVQDVFDKIRHFILPAGVAHEILDWTSPDLIKASSYFEAGMEWWGVFLFTLYIPEYRRLTVTWASSTD